jgi:hypothetical protein
MRQLVQHGVVPDQRFAFDFAGGNAAGGERLPQPVYIVSSVSDLKLVFGSATSVNAASL